MVLAVRAPAATVEASAVWAQSTVRIVPSADPEWTLLDVAAANQAALEELARQVTRHSPAVLTIVGEWRSSVQLWVKRTRRATVSWTVGEPNGLDAASASASAREFADAFGADVTSLTVLLRSPSSSHDGWRELLGALDVPVPTGFPRLGSGELGGGEERVLERRSLLDLVIEDPTDGPLPLAPDRTLEPRWKLIGRALFLAACIAGLAFTLLRDPLRIVPLILLPIGIVVTAVKLAHQISLRRRLRRAERQPEGAPS